MAQDYLDLVSNVEAMYPRAIGGSSRDEPLRLQLVPFANNAMKEVERIRRWSLAYGTAQQVTTQGVAIYAIPAAILAITNLYWLTRLDFRVGWRTTRLELRRVYGEGSIPQAASWILDPRHEYPDLPFAGSGGSGRQLHAHLRGLPDPSADRRDDGTVSNSTVLTVPSTVPGDRGIPTSAIGRASRFAGPGTRSPRR
jgi:hypothetical protein